MPKKKDFGEEVLIEYNKYLLSEKKEYFTLLIRKLITNNLSKHFQGRNSLPSEDLIDLQTDIIIYCLSKLKNIKDPTSKRIFNYLNLSVKFRILDYKRNMAKKIDRDQIIKSKKVSVLYNDDTSLSHFNGLTKQVAECLSNKMTTKEISEYLNIDTKLVNSVRKEIKSYYNNIYA